ncbi:TPA: hypothetical protein GDO54_018604 [Pyxicephalus adspersus]|uniref:Secreted protein n=1 Tax=Pyxicephalus adspersus TaxID=30357 RepID=A0AAV2ZI25_PYXAD|nr:TPA: hypothetical protein GDO54_018604 [Pyxicephalus adspersus]
MYPNLGHKLCRLVVFLISLFSNNLLQQYIWVTYGNTGSKMQKPLFSSLNRHNLFCYSPTLLKSSFLPNENCHLSNFGYSCLANNPRLPQYYCGL